MNRPKPYIVKDHAKPANQVGLSGMIDLIEHAQSICMLIQITSWVSQAFQGLLG